MNKDTSVIPQGMYCYTIIDTPSKENGYKLKIKDCPYLSLNPNKPNQMNGYCSFLEYGDWDSEISENIPEGFPLSALSLLWDQCKECGINDNEELD
ncbi:MAG: hypothetical protein M0Q13_10340 [Methanothrix sp.]|jgi:hypothetical protein|nr:hypothetical protein [Methanothrix sp.]